VFVSVEPSIRRRLEMDDDVKDSTPSGARAACVPLTGLTLRKSLRPLHPSSR
jgi:hypothetical protein